jgi:hypothetical protein
MRTKRPGNKHPCGWDLRVNPTSPLAVALPPGGFDLPRWVLFKKRHFDIFWTRFSPFSGGKSILDGLGRD